MRHKETVHVSITGADGKEYAGDFVWLRRTLGDTPRIAAEESRLMGGAEVPKTIHGDIVVMMAELRVVTEAAPPWWDFDLLYDDSLLFKIYSRYAEWRDAFFRPAKDVVERPKSDSPGNPEVPSGSSESKPGEGVPAPVVVQKVQVAAHR